MIKEFVTLLCFFALEGFANSENKTKYLALPSDSISDCEKIQKLFVDSVRFGNLEKLKERLKDLKAMSNEIRREIEKKSVHIERFDDTGLIRGNVKYFIRIWRHPPKEKFNMPIFK